MRGGHRRGNGGNPPPLRLAMNIWQKGVHLDAPNERRRRRVLSSSFFFIFVEARSSKYSKGRTAPSKNFKEIKTLRQDFGANGAATA